VVLWGRFWPRFGLESHHGDFHAAELLGRPYASKGIGENSQVAAAQWFCLS